VAVVDCLALTDLRLQTAGIEVFGQHIGHDVILGPTLVVNCGRFSIADGAVKSCSRTRICPSDRCVAAGSVLPRAKAKEGVDMPASGLDGGAPARFIREIKEYQWWDRAYSYTPPVPFDDEKFRVE
jgi:hypothetical protein